MSGADNRTLVLDMLQPFRRALAGATSTSSSHQHARSAAAKLDFDATDSDILSKRKPSFEATPSPLKRPRTDSNVGPSPSGGASPWQISRFKAEALDSRVQIDKLEKQISHQHVIRKEMEELFENERQIFISERKSKDNAITEMEQKLRSMRSKETELREQISKSNNEFNDFKHSIEKDKQSMQREIFELKNDLANSKISSNEQISKFKKEILELTQNLECTKKDMEQYKNAYEEANTEAQKVVALQETIDRQSLSLQQTEQRLREFENSKKDQEEMKVLQKRLISMPALEKEVVRLREESTELRAAARQNLLLEEQVQFFKSRLDSLEPLYQNYCDLQKSRSDIERTLEEWKRVGMAYESPEPQSLITQLENFQQRELALLTEKKDIDLSLSTTKSELMNIKHEYKKAVSKLNDVQNIQKTQESFIHRLQKKLLLVSRERDSYRQQLDCYEKELTMNIHGAEGQQNPAIASIRIEGLEKTLQGYKELVTKLEEDMATLRGTPAQQEQLSRLKDEIMNLTKENEILRQHSDKIDIQLERSLCSNEPSQPSNMKILHLVQNPLTRAQECIKAELEKAHSEIAQLKYKIKKLEANELEMTQKLNETMQSAAPSSEEYNQLKEQLESSKIKLQRMKEVFTSSSQEYRDVCYMLMGYKMDRIGVNNYRLSNMYADSPNQYLSFKLSDGGIEMVQTEYSGTISDLVDEHLHHHKSFPVFLSELTLDLFKRTTIVEDSMTQ